MADDNPFIWHDLVTSDQRKCGELYSQLMGWKLKEVDAGEFGIYTLFQKTGMTSQA